MLFPDADLLQLTSSWLVEATLQQAHRYAVGDVTEVREVDTYYQLHHYVRMCLDPRTATLGLMFAPGLTPLLASLPEERRAVFLVVIERQRQQELSVLQIAMQQERHQELESGPHRWETERQRLERLRLMRASLVRHRTQ